MIYKCKKVQIKTWFKNADDVSSIFGSFGALRPIAARDNALQPAQCGA